MTKTFLNESTMYVYICSGHNLTLAVQDAWKIFSHEIRKLPKHETDLAQSANYFVIANINYSWSRRLDLYKADMIATGDWIRGENGSSGKLRNSSKKYFLKIAAYSVREANCN